MEASQPNHVLSTLGNKSGRSFIFPLDGMYQYYQHSLPEYEILKGEEVPMPYRQLLVHANDMTPTLERFHNDKIWIRPEARYLDGNFYFREVILFLEHSLKSVEYGAIVIHLELYPEAAKEAILEARIPLGTLMQQFAIPHYSQPVGYFKIIADGLISQRLHMPDNTILYGRRNALLNMNNQSLAEIVEILPSNEDFIHDPLV